MLKMAATYRSHHYWPRSSAFVTGPVSGHLNAGTHHKLCQSFMTTSAYLGKDSTFSGPWSCWVWHFGFSLPNSYSPSTVMKQPLPDTFSQLLPKTFLHLEIPILPRFPFLISRNLYFGYAVPFLFVYHGNWPTFPSQGRSLVV